MWYSASLAINHTVVALAVSECVASAKTALVSDVGLPTSAAYLSQAAEAVGLPMFFAPFLESSSLSRVGKVVPLLLVVLERLSAGRCSSLSSWQA